MQLYRRTREYSVEWDAAREALIVRVDMLDEHHDMGVAVVFSYPELAIREIHPRMDRTPYPVCPQALEKVQSCVGLQVRAGVSLMITRQIGGNAGCTHVTNLLIDACHSVVQGLLAMHAQQKDSDRRSVLPAPEKIAFLEQHSLSPRNTCVAYTLPEDLL